MKYFDGDLLSTIDDDTKDIDTFGNLLSIQRYTYCIAYRAPNRTIQRYITAGPNMKAVLDEFWRSGQGDRIYAVTKLDDSVTHLDLLKETCR